MILVDSDIFMYAAGALHPNKEPSLAFLRRISSGDLQPALDAEVLHEILYRYRTIGRWTEGVQVYRLARRVVPMVLSVNSEVTDQALTLLEQHEGLTARDALHAAVCQVAGAEGICSYDRRFDLIEGLKRWEPGELG